MRLTTCFTALAGIGKVAAGADLAAIAAQSLTSSGLEVDRGDVLMNESITRAAGGTHGQQLSTAALEQIARRIGRMPWQRTTLNEAAGPGVGARTAAV